MFKKPFPLIFFKKIYFMICASALQWTNQD